MLYVGARYAMENNGYLLNNNVNILNELGLRDRREVGGRSPLFKRGQLIKKRILFIAVSLRKCACFAGGGGVCWSVRWT